MLPAHDTLRLSLAGVDSSMVTPMPATREDMLRRNALGGISPSGRSACTRCCPAANAAYVSPVYVRSAPYSLCTCLPAARELRERLTGVRASASHRRAQAQRTRSGAPRRVDSRGCIHSGSRRTRWAGALAALQRTVQNAARRPQVNRVHRAIRAEHRLRQLRVACVEAVGVRAVHAAAWPSRLTSTRPARPPAPGGAARRASPACRRSTGARSRSAQHKRLGRSQRSGRTRGALAGIGTRPSVTLARSSCAAAGRALRHAQLARSSPCHLPAVAGRCLRVLRTAAPPRALSSQRTPAAASRCAA